MAGVVVVNVGAGDGAASTAAGVGLTAVDSVLSGATADTGLTEAAVVVSTEGSPAGTFSGSSVVCVGCDGALGSSDESEDAARRLLKDVGKAERAELAWGTEKAGFVLFSGGLNKLRDTDTLDKSGPDESSADLWTPAPKLNCVAPLLTPNALSPKVKAAAEGLLAPSLASSPWPTRSPEKQPSVSPPIVLEGCGSTLRAVVVEAALAASPGWFGGRLGDPLRRAGEVDFGAKENVSSLVCPKTILPFPLKENLLTSLTGGKRRKQQKQNIKVMCIFVFITSRTY